jgi:ABC-type bacteriocin/lantibiotic exporter with double-glycine peptidase domain
MVVVVCLRGLAGYRVQRAISAFSDHHRADLMNRLLISYLRKPLQFHVARGSSALLNVVIWHTSIFSSWTLSSALRAVMDGVVLLALVVLLARTNLVAVLILLALLAVTSGSCIPSSGHVRARRTPSRLRRTPVMSNAPRARGIREIILGRGH